VAVWLNFILLERHDDPDRRRSARPDADASYRARWAPGGILEPTSQCDQGHTHCDVRSARRKRTVAKAPWLINHSFIHSINQFGVFVK
jgi:hypothetical protein